MNKIKWIVFSVVTIGFLAILIIFSGSSKIDVSKINVNAVQVASTQNGNIADHVFGKSDSKVTLVEYGDFQCSACFAAHPVIKAVTEAYKDQIQYVFRNFTLGAASGHPNGTIAATAAEAAGLQGKYWDMYNLVYEGQNSWTYLSGDKLISVFDGYAQTLNLDMTKFRADSSQGNSVINKDISAKISFDKALGYKQSVDATPTLFLNGTKLSGENWNDYTKSSQELKDEINKELTKAGIALPN